VDSTIIYLALFVTLVSVAVGMTILAVRRDGRGAGDLILQLIVWVTVAALLPLTSYAGATLLHPRTRLTDLMARQMRTQQETYDTENVDARTKARDQGEMLRKEIESERRAFYRAMFWVGFPIGFAAFVAGFFVRSVPVGTGLTFGGLCTLTAGCYSYWDDMGDGLRFSSLLLLLVTTVAIGLLKFRRPVTAA
jgi:hypothetical protein